MLGTGPVLRDTTIYFLATSFLNIRNLRLPSLGRPDEFPLSVPILRLILGCEDPQVFAGLTYVRGDGPGLAMMVWYPILPAMSEALDVTLTSLMMTQSPTHRISYWEAL